MGLHPAVRDAARQRHLHLIGGRTRRGARHCRGDLPAAADVHDGRDAAGRRALGRDDAAGASPGWASSTAATSAAPSSAACSPASICCASSTWRSPPTWPWRSTSRSRRSACCLSKSTPYTPATVADGARVERAPGATRVYIAIALSGFTALAAQVLWTRLLSLLFGATVYTFSLILGGVPGRSRHRQHDRRGDRAQTRQPARRARLVSDAALRRAGLGRRTC